MYILIFGFYKKKAHELKTVMEEEGYRVWRSLEIYENNIIPEMRHTTHASGEILTQTYHDINKRIAESKSEETNASTVVSWADQVTSGKCIICI